MFQAMNDAIKEESVAFVFHAEIDVEGLKAEIAARKAAEEREEGDGEESEPQPTLTVKGLEAPQPAAQLRYTAPSEDGSVEERSVRSDGTATATATAGQPSRAERRSKKNKKKAKRR
jgi:preprotein translocase subunit SecA